MQLLPLSLVISISLSLSLSSFFPPFLCHRLLHLTVNVTHLLVIAKQFCFAVPYRHAGGFGISPVVLVNVQSKRKPNPTVSPPFFFSSVNLLLLSTLSQSSHCYQYFYNIINSIAVLTPFIIIASCFPTTSLMTFIFVVLDSVIDASFTLLSSRS